MTRKRDFDQLQDEIQELFSDLWHVPRFSGLRGGFRPPADVFRTEDPPQLTVLLELPGVDPDAVELVVGNGELFVSGERVRPRCPGQVYHQVELDYGSFRRRIALDDDVDVANARATYEGGILKVVIPISERRTTEPVSIEVTRS
jgi:HSP20 family protein